ncbi:MAG: YhcH/YjgK/YiaL family protein [Opitutus sp.]
MIYDHIKNAALYRGLNARFAQAFDYLAQFDPSTVDGRVSLDGDNVFALVQSYQTADAATKQFESHRVYADIQFLASGEEVIYTSPLDRLEVTTPYNPTNDAALYRGLDDTPLRLRVGDFAVLWPQDGHKPCCSAAAPHAVKKVVIKVRV